MERTVAEGFRVLAAIAAGEREPGAIAARLDLSEDAVASHLDTLTASGLLRHDSDRLLLSDRMTALLDGLVGRTDLLAIAAPSVLETETRLGVLIEIEVPRERDPRAFVGSSPFAIVEDGGTRHLVTCVLDVAGEAACVLRMAVDGVARDEVELLGKELVATADAIAVQLPRRKDRGPDWRLRS